MLNVKYLTLFKQKNWKKAGILTKVARKIELCSIFFATQCRVLAWFELKFSSLSNASNFRALGLILIELWPFSPHNLSKNDFFFCIFSAKWPPQEESKCKNAQFLQWILKDDDVYFQKITASKIWGNSFIMKNIGFLHNMLPPQYCVTGPWWVKQARDWWMISCNDRNITNTKTEMSPFYWQYIWSCQNDNFWLSGDDESLCCNGL